MKRYFSFSKFQDWNFIVIYWPATERSIKKCTCVNKWENSGSRWALNNNITRAQTAWVSWSQLGTRCQRENQLADWGLAALSDPQLSNLAKMRNNYFWVNIAVCSRLQLISHTKPTSTLSRIKCERYIFMKKCIRSFIEVRILSVDCLRIYVYMDTCTCITAIQHKLLDAI